MERLTGAQPVLDRPWRLHRNTIWRGLIDALGDAYPISRRVVGEECFETMARAYIRRHPPTEASLILYGAELPAFIEVYPPLASLPYARDLARLERAWLESYHAAETGTLTAAEVAAIDPEVLMARAMMLHPSCRLVASAHPIDVIWSLHQRDEIEDQTLPARGAHLLVCRPDDAVLVQAVDPSCFDILLALMAGASLGRALDAAGGVESGLPHLQRLVALRLFGSFGNQGDSWKI